MSDDFFKLIFLGTGILVIFTLIAYMGTLGISGPWADVNILIAPLFFVIFSIGFIAYMVTHR